MGHSNPRDDLHVQRFSRPSRSTAPAPRRRPSVAARFESRVRGKPWVPQLERPSRSDRSGTTPEAQRSAGLCNHRRWMPELPRGTVTFLFTDLQASTDLTRTLGERYAEVLSESRRLLRGALAERGGSRWTRRAMGCLPHSTRHAMPCSPPPPRDRMRSTCGPSDEVVRIRMGLHTAEPHVWEEGYTGLGLTRAARICAAGHGGQVLLSRSTAGIVADDPSRDRPSPPGQSSAERGSYGPSRSSSS